MTYLLLVEKGRHTGYAEDSDDIIPVLVLDGCRYRYDAVWRGETPVRVSYVPEEAA